MTFTTAPLAGPLSLSGPPVLDLRLMTDRPDAHLTAALEVLGASGSPLTHSSGTPVATYGLRSLRHLDPIDDGWFRQEQGRPAPVDKALRVPIRFLPTDLVVPKGGRLRITIAGRTGNLRESLPSGAGATITLLHDCDEPSALRFRHADPRAERLNVLEPSEVGKPPVSAPAAMGAQDGAGASAARVCGRPPSDPDRALGR